MAKQVSKCEPITIKLDINTGNEIELLKPKMKLNLIKQSYGLSEDIVLFQVQLGIDINNAWKLRTILLNNEARKQLFSLIDNKFVCDIEE